MPNNPENTSSTITTARSVPTASMHRRGSFDHHRPGARQSERERDGDERPAATRPACSRSSPSAWRRRARRWSTAASHERRHAVGIAPSGFALLTVAAANAAMKGGVSSTPRSDVEDERPVVAGDEKQGQLERQQEAHHAGSDRPCRRHSNHACARAGEEKRSRRRGRTSAIWPSRANTPRQSGTSPRRARATAKQAARYASGSCGARKATISGSGRFVMDRQRERRRRA